MYFQALSIIASIIIFLGLVDSIIFEDDCLDIIPLMD